MKKIALLLLLATAVVGRAQTSTELLPVGTEAPDFQITDDKTGEKIFRLSDWKTKTDADGKVVPGVWTVLDFWASWCPDCRKDMPKVKEISKKYLTKIQLVGVSFDTDKEKMNKYLSNNHYNRWMQYCEGKKWKETQISKDYHISWIPTSYLIDPEGKVYFTTVKAEEMMQKLDSLDNLGKLTAFKEMPQYPGGKELLMKQIAVNTKFPKICQKYKASAKVKVGFIVENDGSVSDVGIESYQVLNAPNGKEFNNLSGADQARVRSQIRTFFEQEGIRVVNTLGKWTPGKIRGEAVRVHFTVPLVFRLN